ncbi:MAG: hypothetical protein ACTSU0_12115 [Alphaproteobacteria bacterium]
MRKRLGIVIASAVMALVLAAPAAPPATTAIGGWPLLPIACAFVLPLLQSAKLQRELTGPEISASTLICLTGPLGYYIATENGWIGPDFFAMPETE